MAVYPIVYNQIIDSNMNRANVLDVYEPPVIEVYSLVIEGNIAVSQTSSLENIEDDTTEHGWGGNN